MCRSEPAAAAGAAALRGAGRPGGARIGWLRKPGARAGEGARRLGSAAFTCENARQLGGRGQRGAGPRFSCNVGRPAASRARGCRQCGPFLAPLLWVRGVEPRAGGLPENPSRGSPAHRRCTQEARHCSNRDASCPTRSRPPIAARQVRPRPRALVPRQQADAPIQAIESPTVQRPREPRPAIAPPPSRCCVQSSCARRAAAPGGRQSAGNFSITSGGHRWRSGCCRRR
jgi:hypothetical protein